MKKILTPFLIAACVVSMPLLTADIATAKTKATSSKIKSYNPEQRKKLFEWAIKECRKQYGGAGATRPEINYVTGQISCWG
jgi:hypothetical protein